MLKRCEFFISSAPDHRERCDRPSHRVSQDRHYCREHFDAVLDVAKTAVVEQAEAYFSRMDQPNSSDLEYKVWDAIEDLKELNWEPGD